MHIAASACNFGNSGCAKHETIAIPLADETLRRRVIDGYRIKIWPKEGEAEILTLSPKMIQQQLSKVDAMVQGEAPPPLPPDAPRLGIGVVAATSAPYEAEPRGVIVVVTTPQSPAAAAGRRARRRAARDRRAADPRHRRHRAHRGRPCRAAHRYVRTRARRQAVLGNPATLTARGEA